MDVMVIRSFSIAAGIAALSKEKMQKLENIVKELEEKLSGD
ncbi:hypothetical protein ACLIBG_14545 [Virgibacillus sp. W0181]